MRRRSLLLGTLAVTACTAPGETRATSPAGSGPGAGTAATRTAPDGRPFVVNEIARISEPWAMTFLPDGDLLVTCSPGRLLLRQQATGVVREVTGTPRVDSAGQGGLGDVVLSPGFASDRLVYLTWSESGSGGTGGAMGRGRLNGTTLEGFEVIWRQTPKVSGTGHYSHRIAFSPDGAHLFLSSGDRQKFDPAQDLTVNLGKILRLTPDGGAAPGNPFADRGAVAAEIWSYGHRNPLGLTFDQAGNLWASEMGPQGGDEVNLILPGRNHGWPAVSNGSHYGGSAIPDHRAGDGFEAPKVWWNPSISPAGLLCYTGDVFGQWKGDLFSGALSGQSLVRVHVAGTEASKGDQWTMGARVREVEQGPDGTIWLLTDGTDGRLLQLVAP